MSVVVNVLSQLNKKSIRIFRDFNEIFSSFKAHIPHLSPLSSLCLYYTMAKSRGIIRHVIVFRILPIRCARNRDFKTWESRLARGLLLFNKLWNIQLVDGAIFTIVNYAICWPNLLETLYHKAFANSAFLQSLYLYFDSPKA